MKFFRKIAVIASVVALNVSAAVIRSEGECTKPSEELFYALQYHTSCNYNELEKSCYYQCSGSTIRSYCNSIAQYYNVTPPSADDDGSNALKPTPTQKRTKTINGIISCTCVPNPDSYEKVQKDFEKNALDYILDCEKMGGIINTNTLECEIQTGEVCKPICYQEELEKRCQSYGAELRLTLHTEDCGYNAICARPASYTTHLTITKTVKSVLGISTSSSSVVNSTTKKTIATKKLTVTSAVKSLPVDTSNVTIPSGSNTSFSKTLPITSTGKTLPITNTTTAKAIQNVTKTLPITSTGKTLPITNTTTAKAVQNVTKTLPITSTGKTLPITNTTTTKAIQNVTKTLPITSTGKTLPITNTTTSKAIQNVTKTLPITYTGKTLPIINTTTTKAIQSVTKTLPITSTGKTLNTTTTNTIQNTSKTLPITGKTLPITNTTTTKAIQNTSKTLPITGKTLPITNTTTTKAIQNTSKTLPITSKTLPITNTTTTKVIQKTSKTLPITSKTIPNNSVSTQCKPVTVTVTIKETVTVNSIPTNTQNCAAKWQQCGGENYSGPKCCQSGSTCQQLSQYYSQCL